MKSDYFLPIFFWIVLILMYVAPYAFTIEINIWTQLLGYIGGFLLGIQFIGESRIAAADKTLSQNAKINSVRLNQLLLSVLLLDKEERKEKIKMGMWYLFSLIDFFAWYALFDKSPYSFKPSPIELDKVWISVLIAFLYMTLMMLVVFVRRKFFYYMFYVLWVPLAIVGAWITIPWLLFVIVTWGILQLLLLIVHIKNKLSLGNVFYILGFLLLSTSFVLFLLEQINKSG